MFLGNKLAAGLVALSVVTGAVPASAVEFYISNQPGGYIDTAPEYGHGWEYDRRGLTYRELRRALRHQGFFLVDIIDRGRRTYLVRAENHRGRDFIVRVSARSGNVLDARPLRRWADGYGHGGWGSEHRYRRDRERY